MKSLILLIALSISVLFQPSLGFAAEITPVKNHPMGCEYKVTGLINNGDAEKIDKVLKENDWFEVAARGWKICLDSPGGSFVEGVKLAKTFAENSIGTVVAQNKVCESACAIAFLGGTYANPEAENAHVSRTMHATAKLGFHAPALLIREGNYTKNEVDKAYEIALKAVAQLSDMRLDSYSRSGGFDIRESLFKAIILTPFEKMHYVNTVDKAIRYKIDVDGIHVSTADVQSIANNICENAAVEIKDTQVSTGNGSFEILTDGGYFSPDDTLIIYGGYFAEASAGCKISIDTDPRSNAFLVRFFYGDGEPFVNVSLSSFASFPGATLLASAFSEQSISASEFLAKARRTLKNSRVSEDPKTCGITNRSATITNVQNFTNLRRESYLQARIIGRVPLGASVKIRQPGTYWRPDKCAATCNGKNQNAIKQCIDNNDVWIEVEYNGRRGFLSRKFLE